MDYSYYDNMNGSEKDKMVDGSEIRRLTETYRSKNQLHSSPDNNLATPKRRRHDDNDNDVQLIEDNNSFKTVEKRNRKKTRTVTNTDEYSTIEDKLDKATSKGYQGQAVNDKRNNTGRIIFNSQLQNGKKIYEQRRGEEKYENTEMKDNIDTTQLRTRETNVQSYSKYNITQHALQYAVKEQLPSLKIKCQPGVKDQLEGANIIKALFKYIHEDFCKLNNQKNRPIGFDTWYVDKQGDLLCYTNQIEIFVYLH